MHADRPLDGAYEPSSHTLHTPLDAAAKLPALHASGAVEPVPQELPAGHSTHAAAPAADA